MAQHTLTLTFTDDQLKNLDARGLQVVLLQGTAAAQPLPVAWIVFAPFPNNIVTWQDAYGLYAASGSVQQGSVLDALDSTPRTAENWAYAFTADGYLQAQPATPPPHTYQVVNNCQKESRFVFGLTQDVTVDEQLMPGAFVSATAVGPNMTISLVPPAQYGLVLAWGVQPGQLLTPALQPVTQFTFPSGQTALSMLYNDTTGLFEPAASTQLSTPSI